MDDLISRQAALNALSRGSGCGASCHRAIKALPSAQPDRGEGRWIIQDHPATGWFRVICSECGEDVTSNAPIIGFFPNAKCIWDFCPWCGAKMGGGAE